MATLADLMENAARELSVGIEASRAAFGHNLTKGEAVEAAVRDFFRKYYPQSIGVAHGQVVDAKGAMSKQLDVILYDAARTPILYTDRENEQRLIPVEGVIAAVEVKTKLVLADLPAIAESARVLKSLDRSAYYFSERSIVQTAQRAYGQEWPVMPPMFFIVAFDGPAPGRVAARLKIAHDGLPHHQRVDLACVLNQGVVVNQSSGGMIEAVPSPETSIGGYETKRALFLFHVLASRYILQSNIPPIALQKYLPPEFAF
jgi:hypothetical protein